MKKIFFLLLFTIASYGQAVFDEGIQITGNANSATATKVNVQEANGKVNTQTINTGFNKNIGLGGSDVVGANTLLNQYATTPSGWTAQSYVLNSVVFYGGKQWVAKIATVAVDVPSVSSKWEEITFEALANKTVTVDQTIIDGSTNAVSSNAVFDGLALKANDNIVVKLTGNQLISDIKTISNNVNETRLQLTNTATSTREVLRVINPSGSVANGSEFYNNSNSLGKGAIYVNSSGTGVGLLSEISSGSSDTNAIRVEVPSVATIENAVVFNTVTNSNLGNHLAFKVNNQNVATVSKSGDITAKSFTKSGGTSSQFLKADGSLDSNTYALASSVHNPVTLGTANGLSLATQVLSLGLASSGVTGALSGTDWNTFNGKFNTPTGLTTNYLPKWNGSGFGNSGFYEDATGLNINGVLKGITFDNPKIAGTPHSYGIMHKIDGVNKWSINIGAGDGSENYNIYSFATYKRLVSYKTNGNIEFIPDGGRALFNTTVDNGVDKIQVAGTISASPATTANQVPTWGQVQAVASGSGIWTPATNGVLSYTKSYWIKSGNVVSFTVNGNVNSSIGLSATIALPNGFNISSPITLRTIGVSKLLSNQDVDSGVVRILEISSTNTVSINTLATVLGTYSFSVNFTVQVQ